MTTYYVEVRFTVRPTDEVDQFSDDLMSALLVEPNLIDPDLGVHLTTGVIDACMVVDAEDQPSAVQLGFVALRSACHKIGGATQTWEADLERALATVRPPEVTGV